MKIDNPTGNAECNKPDYSVRFEPRRVEDLRFPHKPAAFGRLPHRRDGVPLTGEPMTEIRDPVCGRTVALGRPQRWSITIAGPFSSAPIDAEGPSRRTPPGTGAIIPHWRREECPDERSIPPRIRALQGARGQAG